MLRRAYIAVAVGVFAVWWAAILVRLASVDPLIAAWWRFTIGASTLLVLAQLRSSFSFERLGVVAGVLLYLHMLLWFDSLLHSPVIASTAIVTTYPVFIAAYEAARRIIPAWRALLVSVPLVATALYASLGVDWAPLLESLASSISISLYFIVLREARLRGAETTGLAASAYTASALLATITSLLHGVNPLLVDEERLPYLLALGLVPMAVGHTLLNYALAYLPASVVTSAVLTEPLGAALLASLILGENPPLSYWLLAAILAIVSLVAAYPASSSYRQGQGDGRV